MKKIIAGICALLLPLSGTPSFVCASTQTPASQGLALAEVLQKAIDQCVKDLPAASPIDSNVPLPRCQAIARVVDNDPEKVKTFVSWMNGKDETEKSDIGGRLQKFATTTDIKEQNDIKIKLLTDYQNGIEKKETAEKSKEPSCDKQITDEECKAIKDLFANPVDRGTFEFLIKKDKNEKQDCVDPNPDTLCKRLTQYAKENKDSPHARRTGIDKTQLQVEGGRQINEAWTKLLKEALAADPNLNLKDDAWLTHLPKQNDLATWILNMPEPGQLSGPTGFYCKSYLSPDRQKDSASQAVGTPGKDQYAGSLKEALVVTGQNFRNNRILLDLQSGTGNANSFQSDGSYRHLPNGPASQNGTDNANPAQTRNAPFALQSRTDNSDSTIKTRMTLSCPGTEEPGARLPDVTVPPAPGANPEAVPGGPSAAAKSGPAKGPSMSNLYNNAGAGLIGAIVGGAFALSAFGPAALIAGAVIGAVGTILAAQQLKHPIGG